MIVTYNDTYLPTSTPKFKRQTNMHFHLLMLDIENIKAHEKLVLRNKIIAIKQRSKVNKSSLKGKQRKLDSILLWTMGTNNL